MLNVNSTAFNFILVAIVLRRKDFTIHSNV